MNALCKKLGIEFPIFAFSHCRDVVAAVSRAGGLGVLGAVAFSPEELETELAWIDAHVDGRPYGVDTVIPAAYVGKSEGDLKKEDLEKLIPEGHRQFIEGLLKKHGVPELPEGIEKTESLLGWSMSSGRAHVEVAMKHPIRLIANALGPPPADVIQTAHARGVAVAALCGTVDQALKQKQAGVDIIIASGYEAGGHTGEIGSMVLLPQVVDAVAPTPVLAAGGIGSGRQMAAAMVLGAQGVWAGSILADDPGVGLCACARRQDAGGHVPGHRPLQVHQRKARASAEDHVHRRLGWARVAGDASDASSVHGDRERDSADKPVCADEEAGVGGAPRDAGGAGRRADERSAGGERRRKRHGERLRRRDRARGSAAESGGGMSRDGARQ